VAEQAEGEKTRINREINADKLKITQMQYDIENQRSEVTQLQT